MMGLIVTVNTGMTVVRRVIYILASFPVAVNFCMDQETVKRKFVMGNSVSHFYDGASRIDYTGSDNPLIYENRVASSYTTKSKIRGSSGMREY